MKSATGGIVELQNLPLDQATDDLIQACRTKGMVEVKPCWFVAVQRLDISPLEEQPQLWFPFTQHGRIEWFGVDNVPELVDIRHLPCVL